MSSPIPPATDLYAQFYNSPQFNINELNALTDAINQEQNGWQQAQEQMKEVIEDTDV